jgi:hypothetical protein
MGTSEENGGVTNDETHISAMLAAVCGSSWPRATDEMRRAFFEARKTTWGNEEMVTAWQAFYAGWQARKRAEFGAMYATPHRQLTRPLGAAPHWLRCEHLNADGVRCLLSEGGHAEHVYKQAG